ncbi:hypothetical protein [Ensifer adhaerens]|uniref:hypothetical protein n=1 Tax=Ensifer adhaerens TaxID=106592 RepID=UPI0011783241|nr:hypothetical protein [Ensifer adhaerens]
MFDTANARAFLPHEMNQIEQVFREILRERGLARDCEMAETIARRIFSCYQRGIRERGALKYTIGFDLRAAVQADADRPVHVSQETSMQEIAREPDGQIGPDDLDMLQRTFDRVCIWCDIPRYGKRADRLARHITGQFRRGVSDERVLFENAMWLEQQGGSTWRRANS